jgi:hypothetical protein
MRHIVGYVRWDARSDRFPPCLTIIPAAFRSQSEFPVIWEPRDSLPISRRRGPNRSIRDCEGLS